MAVPDDKIALAYVQAFLRHGGGHKQVNVASTKLVEDFPLLRLIEEKSCDDHKRWQCDVGTKQAHCVTDLRES